MCVERDWPWSGVGGRGVSSVLMERGASLSVDWLELGLFLRCKTAG